MKKDMVSDLNMSNGKMSDFVSFPLIGSELNMPVETFLFYFSSIVRVHFSHKTDKFRF